MRTKLPKLWRISSHVRYDHFDTSPCMLNSVLEYNDYSIFTNNGLSVMSCCGARNFSFAVRFTKFRPRHSLRLVLSATGSTRLIVHFDTSPCIFDCFEIYKASASLTFLMLQQKSGENKSFVRKRKILRNFAHLMGKKHFKVSQTDTDITNKSFLQQLVVYHIYE